MPVHEVARGGFGASAIEYEQARPSYPPDAIGWLLAGLAVGPGSTLVDLAAGTGKLTRQLADRVGRVVAVEPVAAMWALLRGAAPDAAVVPAVAEALPFRDATIDAVTVAQAFHWFDADASLGELRRVLRPHGRVGVLWNGWDRSHDWIRAVHDLVAGAGASEPWRRAHLSPRWLDAVVDAHPGFGAMTRASFRHGQALTRDELDARVASTSHVATMPATDRARLLDRVHEIVDRDPATGDADVLELHTVVDACWFERT